MGGKIRKKLRTVLNQKIRNQMETRGKWSNRPKISSENNFQPRITYPSDSRNKE